MVNQFPFGSDFVLLRDAMQQLLQDSFVPSGGSRSGWNNGSQATARPMPLDVYATRDEAIVIAAMPGLKERAKTLVELLDNASFLYASRPLQLDAKAAEILGNGGRERVAGVLRELEGLREWTVQSTEGAVRAFAEETGVKLGQVAQPLRAALTGKSTSPGLFDVMAVLGRSETLARLKDQASENVA